MGETGVLEPSPPGDAAIAERSAKPTTIKRAVVAFLIATAAATLTYIEPLRAGGDPSDLVQPWSGAVAILAGQNPYPPVPRDSLFESISAHIYPLTSSLVILPLGFFSSLQASTIFIWLSTAVLAFALTADGWYRLPLFLSGPFVLAARRGQWSPLFSAAALLPGLSWTYAAKPNIGLAFLAASTSRKAIYSAVAGGVVLSLIGLAIVPSWPVEWLSRLGNTTLVSSPLLQKGGFLVLFALLRWRRWDARLILALAIVPQTMYWYEAVPLLLIPRTLRESLILALVTSCGFVFAMLFVPVDDVVQMNMDYGSVMVFFAYLPATVMVLRRPNRGDPPAWFQIIAGTLKRGR